VEAVGGLLLQVESLDITLLVFGILVLLILAKAHILENNIRVSSDILNYYHPPKATLMRLAGRSNWPQITQNLCGSLHCSKEYVIWDSPRFLYFSRWDSNCRFIYVFVGRLELNRFPLDWQDQ